MLTNFRRFFQLLTVETVFLVVETKFSSNPASRLVHTDFRLISNHVLLFIFFCCWIALLKLGVNKFSSIFSVPIRGIRVFIKFFITTSVHRFSVNFKPFVFIQIFFCCCRKASLKLAVKQFFEFLIVEVEFSSNSSSRLVDTCFGLSTNRALLLRCIYFCWRKALLKLGVNQFSLMFSVSNSGSSFSD